jgi:hypothetical protein
MMGMSHQRVSQIVRKPAREIPSILAVGDGPEAKLVVSTNVCSIARRFSYPVASPLLLAFFNAIVLICQLIAFRRI